MTIFKKSLFIGLLLLGSGAIYAGPNWSSTVGVSGVGSTDNSCVRADGTAGNAIQGTTTNCTIADNGVISAGGFETSSGTVRFNGTVLDGGSGLITFGGASSPAFNVNAADTTAFSSQMQFSPQAATIIGAVVKMHASQSASAFEVQTSAGGVLVSIGAGGDIVGAGTNQLYAFLQQRTASTTTALSSSHCGQTIISDSADVVTLPEASTVLGCRITFICGTADDFDIDPADTTDNFAQINTVDGGTGSEIDAAGGKYIRCTDIGSSIVIEACTNDLWCGVGSANGAWTAEP